MTVYVDELNTCIRSQCWPYSKACHLMAESEAELHEFARRLKLKREWFQGDHYDLTKNKRAVAIRKGAIKISIYDIVRLRQKLRAEKLSK